MVEVDGNREQQHHDGNQMCEPLQESERMEGEGSGTEEAQEEPAKSPSLTYSCLNTLFILCF